MAAKVEGTSVKLMGEDYVLAPLNFQQIRLVLKPAQAKMKETTDTYDRLALFVPVVHASLSRNHPDLTVEQVEVMLDLNNVHEVYSALMGVSGFVKPTLGGASSEDPLTGTASIGDLSPPSPDGPGSTSMNT